MELLDNVMCWIAYLGDKYEGLQFVPGITTAFSARFLCVHALSTVFLLGGLGVEDKVGVRELSILHRVNCFVRQAKGEVASFKRRTLGEPQRETDILLPLLLSASSRKVFSLSCRLQTFTQGAGICTEIRGE